ncbi:hypothetical protein [Ruegeria hyattellae]|uniref:hypothetical protein n=1 Tax=Ruegeria hyattellae TaxID=3233337 RepID=UPI00355BB830
MLAAREAVKFEAQPGDLIAIDGLSLEIPLHLAAFDAQGPRRWPRFRLQRAKGLPLTRLTAPGSLAGLRPMADTWKAQRPAIA